VSRRNLHWYEALIVAVVLALAALGVVGLFL